MTRSVYYSIGLLAAGVIAFELVLIQIFSITQWYHFAYMVLSVAMLGFGTAGTLLTLFEHWFLDRYRVVFPALLFFTGISMAVVVWISGFSAFRFDTYLVFTDSSQVIRLVLTYLLFFVPFLLAALAIGLTFDRFALRIGKLYFADLFGSGFGAILALLLMWCFLPNELPGLVALLPILAGFISSRKKYISNGIMTLAAMSLLVVILSILRPTSLHLSEFKSLSKSLLLPKAKIENEKCSPFGLVQVVSSPAMRYAPGLSLNFQDKVPVRKGVFNNGDWVGPLVPLSADDSSNVLDYTTRALPYSLFAPDNVLILNAGTGEDVAYALEKDVGSVTCTESNPVLLDLFRNELAAETDSLFHHPNLITHEVESRTFIYSDTNRYDLIILPTVSSFGGSGGLNALQEQYILTVEAFRQMCQRLTLHGMISVTSWIDYPARNPLKLLATLYEAMESLEIRHAEQHIIGIRSWGTITFLLKRTAFSPGEIDRVNAFCVKNSFDPVLLGDQVIETRAMHHQLEDTLFHKTLEALLSPLRKELYESYDFNIRPATDNSPYFSRFFKIKNLGKISDAFGLQSFPFLEIGYLIVLLTFVQIATISMFLIILPLFKLGFQASYRWRILGYFGGIGLGYMFVEIVLIQRFILYFGNPIYATSAVIGTLLVSSGIGSYYSKPLRKKGFKIWVWPLVIILLLVLFAIVLTPSLSNSIAWPGWSKIMVLFLLVGPLGFIMGIPFPSGIATISEKGKGAVPWAWGVNGYFSVISTALATIIAVEMGFQWVLVIAAIGYFLAAISLKSVL